MTNTARFELLFELPRGTFAPVTHVMDKIKMEDLWSNPDWVAGIKSERPQILAQCRDAYLRYGKTRQQIMTELETLK